MKKILFILIMFCLLTFPNTASCEEDILQDIYNDTLSQVERIEIPNFNFTETIDKVMTGKFSFTFHQVIQSIINMFLDEIKRHTTLLIKILVLSILAGILSNLHQSTTSSQTNDISFLACFSIISGLSVSIVANISEIATETINQLKIMMLSFMPILSTLTISAKQGALISFYPTLFVSMQGFTAICSQIFIPIIMTTTALSVVNAMSARFHITRLLDVTRQSVKWALGILLTVFVGILSVHSFTAFATGSIAGKTVKYALCNFIPLVGNTLAESIETVVGSIRIIRGALGVTGVIALLSLCVIPLLKILTISFLYRFAAGFAEPATDRRIVKLLMDLAGNITLLFAILLMVSVMFIISIALLCGLFF